jgi:hypothetical protein
LVVLQAPANATVLIGCCGFDWKTHPANEELLNPNGNPVPRILAVFSSASR